MPEENNEVQSDKTSPALSMENTIKKPDTKSVALLLAGDVDANQVKQWVQTLALHVHHKEALATCRVKQDQPGVFTFDEHNLDGFNAFIDGIATARFWDRA